MEEHIVSQEIVDAVHKEMAKEAGMTLEAFRAMLKQTREDFWCSCEKPGDTIYHTNGITPWPSCVLKHHYHCLTCKKLVQVG